MQTVTSSVVTNSTASINSTSSTNNNSNPSLGLNDIFAHRLTFFNDFKNCSEMYAAALKMCNIPHSINPYGLVGDGHGLNRSSEENEETIGEDTNNEESNLDGLPDKGPNKKRPVVNNSNKTRKEKRLKGSTTATLFHGSNSMDEMERQHEISLGESIERAIHKCLDTDNSNLTSPSPLRNCYLSSSSASSSTNSQSSVPSNKLTPNNESLMSPQQAFNLLFYSNNISSNTFTKNAFTTVGIDNNKTWNPFHANTLSDMNAKSLLSSMSTIARNEPRRAKVIPNYSEAHHVAVDDHFKESLYANSKSSMTSFMNQEALQSIHQYRDPNLRFKIPVPQPGNYSNFMKVEPNQSTTMYNQNQFSNHLTPHVHMSSVAGGKGSFNMNTASNLVKTYNADRLKETYRNLIMPHGMASGSHDSNLNNQNNPYFNGKSVLTPTDIVPLNFNTTNSIPKTINPLIQYPKTSPPSFPNLAAQQKFNLPTNYLEATKCLYDPNFMIKYLNNYLSFNNVPGPIGSVCSITNMNNMNINMNKNISDYPSFGNNCNNTTQTGNDISIPDSFKFFASLLTPPTPSTYADYKTFSSHHHLPTTNTTPIVSKLHKPGIGMMPFTASTTTVSIAESINKAVYANLLRFPGFDPTNMTPPNAIMPNTMLFPDLWNLKFAPNFPRYSLTLPASNNYHTATSCKASQPLLAPSFPYPSSTSTTVISNSAVGYHKPPVKDDTFQNFIEKAVHSALNTNVVQTTNNYRVKSFQNNIFDHGNAKERGGYNKIKATKFTIPVPHQPQQNVTLGDKIPISQAKSSQEISMKDSTCLKKKCDELPSISSDPPKAKDDGLKKLKLKHNWLHRYRDNDDNEAINVKHDLEEECAKNHNFLIEETNKVNNLDDKSHVDCKVSTSSTFQYNEYMERNLAYGINDFNMISTHQLTPNQLTNKYFSSSNEKRGRGRPRKELLFPDNTNPYHYHHHHHFQSLQHNPSINYNSNPADQQFSYAAALKESNVVNVSGLSTPTKNAYDFPENEMEEMQQNSHLVILKSMHYPFIINNESSTCNSFKSLSSNSIHSAPSDNRQTVISLQQKPDFQPEKANKDNCGHLVESKIFNQNLKKYQNQNVIPLSLTPTSSKIKVVIPKNGCLQILTTSNENGYQTFLQKETCNNVVPKISKCWECRLSTTKSNSQNQNIFCRFYAFRKLKLNNKGSLTVAGFSESHEANSDDLKIWLPPKYEEVLESYMSQDWNIAAINTNQHNRDNSSLNDGDNLVLLMSQKLVRDCIYIFQNIIPSFQSLLDKEDEQLKFYFAHIKANNSSGEKNTMQQLKEESCKSTAGTQMPPFNCTKPVAITLNASSTQLQSTGKTTMFGPSRISWKRPVEFIREMCDVCQTTIFNRHLVCPKCGFSVCPDCFDLKTRPSYPGTSDTNEESAELINPTTNPTWPSCSNKQTHETNKLMPTHIIPTIALNEIRQMSEKLMKHFNHKGDTHKGANELIRTPIKDVNKPGATIKNENENSPHTLNGYNKRAFMDFSKLFFRQNINGILSKTFIQTSTKESDNTIGGNDESTIPAPTTSTPLVKIEDTSKSDLKYTNSSLCVLADVALNNSSYDLANFVKSDSQHPLIEMNPKKNTRAAISYFKNLSPSNTLDDVISAVIEHGISQETNSHLIEPIVIPTPRQPISSQSESPLLLSSKESDIKDAIVPNNEDSEKAIISHAIDNKLTELEACENLIDFVPHEWLCDGQVLHLKHKEAPSRSDYSGSFRNQIIDLFREAWKKCKPVLISGLHRDIDEKIWKPEWFANYIFSNEGTQNDSCYHDLVDCCSGKIIKNMKMFEFWAGFNDLKKRDQIRKSFKFVPIISPATSTASINSQTEDQNPDAKKIKLNTDNNSNSSLIPENSDLMLKLKDWPPGDDFANVLPLHFKNFNDMIPLPEYTNRGLYVTYDQYKSKNVISPTMGDKNDCQSPSQDHKYGLNGGIFNMATCLPDLFVKPDLGPKMYIAYGSADNPSQGTTNLHIDVSDAINLLAHVDIPKTLEEGQEVDKSSGSLEGIESQGKCNEDEQSSKSEGKNLSFSDSVWRTIISSGIDEPSLQRLKELEKIRFDTISSIGKDECLSNQTVVIPGALWHIYDPKDAGKIRQFILEEMDALKNGTNLSTNKTDEKKSHLDDPIHDQCTYLDEALNKKLTERHGVKPRVIVQCLGDAIFIPAGAPHQVKNLYSCVKMAQDFVSPEHVEQCLQLTHEFRRLPQTHTNHEDKLQIKNILYHAVKDVCSILNHHHNNTLLPFTSTSPSVT